MCLRYPQASSVATLPTGSILPSPPSPLPHGCILSPTWLYTTLPPKNKTKPVDTDYISGMKNNGCLLKEAHQESLFIDVMID